MNGLPLVVIEAKTPVRSSQSWFDGATQIHDDYERNAPELFVPNLCSVATEGKELRYGSIGLPVDLWGPWRADDDADTPKLERVKRTVSSMLRPSTVLDLLGSYTAYATGKGKRRAKIVARYQQVEAANRIVERVVGGHPKKGLVWHFQGSGKSLLMLFAARKLRLHPALGNPTVIIVVDRIDLDTQISSTFHAADAPNLEKADSRADLERLLAQDARKIIITTIFKFGEVDGVLNDRHNIIVLVDEAHRSQEGDLGRKMRRALPNAFLFGLTGTPISRADRNTFFAFGAEEDEYGYLSRYGFEQSIRDGATKPLHFEPRLPELHIDRAAIDAEYQELTGGLSDLDREQLSKTAARTAVLLKTPERVERICADIAKHFQEKVAPSGFGAQVVTYDRESCVLYKRALDRVLPAEMSDVVMTVNSGEDDYAAYRRDKDAEERLLDRFRDPNDPLKVLIVTSKLLTGFDAPILQTMYLDKPLRDHALLQAICRTNRPYGQSKTHGLIVDYLGVFDDVAQAIQFDEEGITRVVTNLNQLAAALPAAVQKCLAWFSGVDRTVTGYEGLIAAQECLPDNETRDGFAVDYSYLARLWDAISPDPSLEPYEADHAWLGQVYESLKPSSGTGKLLWHTLGAKTIDLIHRHVHVEAVRDDLETLVLARRRRAGRRARHDGPGEEVEGDRDQGRRTAPQTPARPALPCPWRAARRAATEARAGTAGQHRVPEVPARSGSRCGRGRADRRACDPRGTRQGRADRALRGGPQRPYAHHRQADRQRHRRDRPARPLRGVADDPRGRAGGEEGCSADAVQVPPAPGPGAVRPGLWLHPAVLLTLADDISHSPSACSTARMNPLSSSRLT